MSLNNMVSETRFDEGARHKRRHSDIEKIEANN